MLLLRRHGILRDRRLLAPALARELAITGCQLLIDRNTTGIAGRVAD